MSARTKLWQRWRGRETTALVLSTPIFRRIKTLQLSTQTSFERGDWTLWKLKGYLDANAGGLFTKLRRHWSVSKVCNVKRIVSRLETSRE